MKKSKFIVDLFSIIITLATLVTGLVLHKQTHHIFQTDHSLFFIHSGLGLFLLLLIGLHVYQHIQWLTKYNKLPLNKKRFTTILDCVGIVVFVLGIILLLGGTFKPISIIQYIFGIAFTIFVLGHFIKRWGIFKLLTK